MLFISLPVPRIYSAGGYVKVDHNDNWWMRFKCSKCSTKVHEFKSILNGEHISCKVRSCIAWAGYGTNNFYKHGTRSQRMRAATGERNMLRKR